MLLVQMQHCCLFLGSYCKHIWIKYAFILASPVQGLVQLLECTYINITFTWARNGKVWVLILSWHYYRVFIAVSLLFLYIWISRSRLSFTMNMKNTKKRLPCSSCFVWGLAFLFCFFYFFGKCLSPKLYL